jgi:hypothetical protein
MFHESIYINQQNVKYVCRIQQAIVHEQTLWIKLIQLSVLGFMLDSY